MYHILNIFVYLLAPVTAIIGIVLAMVLTYLADFPYKNSKMFLLYWKQILTRKEDRKVLNACVPTGFHLGPYGLARAKLGLQICDDIVRNTVTLLVLGSIREL